MIDQTSDLLSNLINNAAASRFEEVASDDRKERKRVSGRGGNYLAEQALDHSGRAYEGQTRPCGAVVGFGSGAL